MSWRRDRLPELVRQLAGRPRHEALRGHVTELLRSGFNAPYDEISHEVYLLDGSGRIDTMWGAIVIELKSDLRRELDDVKARFPAYLSDAASRSRSTRPVTGLATDGADFIAFMLDGGTLRELARHTTDPERPDDLMAWLEAMLSDRPDLVPEPRAVAQAFGRASSTFGRARLALDADNATPEAVGRALRRIEGAAPADADAMAGTLAQLQALYHSGRNGIWTFVFRNLVRPVWLSRPEQRADVLIGNPPWIVYRHLSPGMKDRLRKALDEYGLWVGGNLATQQDLCALFWARGAERYLVPGGRLAFVLPYAALNAPVYAQLRNGRMNQVRVRLTAAWSLERVWPIFGAQSGSGTTSTCVLFGRREMAGDHPGEVDRWEGHLPRRDANEAEASRALVHSRVPWPRARTLTGASLYRTRFRDGATIYPRRFFLVEPEPTSHLGSRRAAPLMRGRAGPLDKRPWTTVDPPRGPVEAEFLRQVVLGETVAPFRLLDTVTAVIPFSGPRLLDSAEASAAGHRHLAAWLRDAETKWAEHSNKKADGQPRMTLAAQIDHMRKLSCQAGTPTIRVFYTKAGTRLSAARLAAGDALVDHMAYWATARSSAEAAYLIAVINSDAVLAKVADLQPRGEVGRRHFDNLVWTLPIPEYDETDPLHRDLAVAAAHAETVAALVELTDTQHFTAKRRAIRAALAADGVAAEIEALVDALLPP